MRRGCTAADHLREQHAEPAHDHHEQQTRDGYGDDAHQPTVRDQAERRRATSGCSPAKSPRRHSVDMSSSLSFFVFAPARRRRNVRANGYRREFAAILPFRLFPLTSSSSFVSFASTSAYVSSASDSTPASNQRLFEALFLFSASARHRESTAILLIMSVDVTGHTAKTRGAVLQHAVALGSSRARSSAKSSA